LPLLGCQGLQYGTLSTTLGTSGATRKLVTSLAEARGTSFSAHWWLEQSRASCRNCWFRSILVGQPSKVYGVGFGPMPVALGSCRWTILWVERSTPIHSTASVKESLKHQDKPHASGVSFPLTSLSRLSQAFRY
jgi:hypothetical protein